MFAFKVNAFFFSKFKILMMPNNEDLELVKKQTKNNGVFLREKDFFSLISGKLYIFVSCFIPFSQMIFLSVLVCVQDCFPLYQSPAMPTSLSDLQLPVNSFQGRKLVQLLSSTALPWAKYLFMVTTSVWRRERLMGSEYIDV